MSKYTVEYEFATGEVQREVMNNRYGLALCVQDALGLHPGLKITIVNVGDDAPTKEN